jgi:AI-2 transport protein TqsA
MSSTSRALLTLAAVVVIAAGMKAAQEVVVPFLLAAFIATIAAPPVFWLAHRRVPAPLAITTVMIGIILALAGVAALLFRSGNAFTSRLPFYQERVTELVGQLAQWLAGFGLDVSSEVALSYFNPGTALDLAGNLLRGLGGVMSSGFFILLTVIFILAEASSFPAKLRATLADPDRDLQHFDRFAVNVNRYIAIKSSTSLATGILVSVVLLVIGVDFPILWGLLAFLLNFVPTIGGAGGHGLLSRHQHRHGQHDRAPLLGPGPRAVHARRLPLPGGVGVAAGARWHVSLGAADHDRQDCPRGQPGHHLDRSSARTPRASSYERKR